jgi:predicted nucleic acid-binding protein
MSFARRIVIDTGVLVSAAICPESVPALALEKALLQFEVCACDDTLAELETVLQRSKFDRYVAPDVRREFVAGLRHRVARIAVMQTVVLKSVSDIWRSLIALKKQRELSGPREVSGDLTAELHRPCWPGRCGRRSESGMRAPDVLRAIERCKRARGHSIPCIWAFSKPRFYPKLPTSLVPL